MSRKKHNVKWLIEQFSEVVPSDAGAVFDSLVGLKPRELVIVGAATVDLGLAHLLSKRLNGSPSLINDFLGADEDGRAPAGSFGARIDLARLTGVIGDWGHKLLRELKGLRNLMAHRVKMDFAHPKAQARLVAFLTLWHDHLKAYIKDNPNDERAIGLEEYAKDWLTRPSAPETGDEAIRIYVTVMCGNFLQQEKTISRITPTESFLALTEESGGKH
jgi:hypothetical protein